MTLRVGIVSEPVPGHLNRALTLGRELAGRGHDVVAFGIADVRGAVDASGLRHVAVGEAEFPPGALASRWLQPEHSRGVRALLESVRLHVEETEVLCRDVPPRAAGVDVLLVDQLQVCGRHLADAVGARMVTVCAGPGLLRLPDDSFPPPFLDRSPSTRPVDRAVHRLAFSAMGLVAWPRLRVVNRWARRRGTPVRRSFAATSSPDLHVSMLVPELDFDVAPPAGSPLRHFGPLIDDRRPPVAFPWDRLDGRPLVYASLGTVQSNADDLHRIIADACAGLDVQLVLSRGEDGPTPAFAGDPIVVDHAPQLELLRRASLCITHCGMNTTMECAAFGVPVVGIPIVYDQPAVAARIRHAGVGLTIPHRRVDAPSLRAAVSTVLGDPAFRRRAEAVAGSCARHGGPSAAADAIEAVAGVRPSSST